MNRHPFITWLWPGLGLLLLAACQTDLAPAATPPAALVEDASLGAIAPAPESAAPAGQATVPAAASRPPAPGGLAVAGGSLDQDAQGIPIGFTQEGRPFRGDPAAPVILREFSDYQCPYCARFTSQTMPELLANQIAGGEVVAVFYDFPLTSIHPQAVAAANAARCAGEHGAAAYWAMHDALFRNPGEWGHGQANDTFAAYAGQLDVDSAAFAACLAENRYESDILADVDLGQAQGVRSTPSFFINDQLLVGAQPLTVFNQAIAAVQNGEVIAAAAPTATPAAVAPAVAPTPARISQASMAGALGDPNAPVTIVEFTDYQCPYCARHAAETFPRLLTEMIEAGRVFYVVKDFPLEQIHPEARAAAAAARCAGEQEAYWRMHDALFEAQAQWSEQGAETAQRRFVDMALGLNLDTTAFSDCLESGRHDLAIQDNFDEGVALGVRGTPAFFIDGFPVNGAQPFDLFVYAVELAEAGTLAEAYVRQPAPTPTPAGPRDVPTEGSYAMGDPDAPVTIVEFTDYQCPFCARHHSQTLPQIKASYIDEGLVYYVFKDFPLTNIHPLAQAAAEAARCAGDQGDYLGMHDLLFARQSEWSGLSDPLTTFTSYATQLDLEAEPFSDCLLAGTHEAAVRSDLELGASLGITGTPGFFINGYFLSGAQPFSEFERAVQHFLSR